MRRSIPLLLGVLLLAAATPPASASNALIAQGQAVAVAKSALKVTPDREWNKLGARPGRLAETWTLDGDGLNDLTFYGGIETSHALFREVSKKTRPLPHFSSTMLLTDIPALFEASYRIALDTPLMEIASVAPATLAGVKAVRFRYRFTRQGEDVEREGEAVAAIIDRKLYMISFEAPALYYFAHDVDGYRAVVATARVR